MAQEGDMGDYEDTDRMMQFQNSLISMEDAASMYRVRTRPNDPPYSVSVCKLNNRLVDQWKKTVLLRYANTDGKVPCAIVEPSWDTFYEGTQVIKLAELHEKGLVPQPTEEQLSYWVNFFENSTIEDMHPYGSGVIHMGWKLIEDHIRLSSALKKYSLIYGISEDPFDWIGYAHKNDALCKGKVLPFWGSEKLNEIRERVITILSIRPTPK